MNNAQPQSFNPWPVGIVAFFIGFIAVIVGLIVFLSSQGMDLVTPDYYEQEVRYQSQHERIGRTEALAQQINVSHDASAQRITITLPASHAQQSCLGDIQLYRPSDASLDRRIKLEVGTQGTQALDAKDLQPGLWKVRVTWKAGGQEFYTDQSVVVLPRPS